jgi:Flp pilus assembly protein TadD
VNEKQRANIEAAERAVRQSPADFALYGKLGWAHFEGGQYDQALTAFQRAAKLDPNDPRPHNASGRVYYRLDLPEEALAAYRRAIALDPHNVNSYFGIAILHWTKMVDWEAANRALREGLEANPDEPLLVAAVGSTYARSGRFDEAENAYKQALGLDPENDHALGMLRIVYLAQDRYQDAIAVCERAIEVEDGNDPRRMLGYTYDRMGRAEEAQAEFERALAFNPDDYEVRAALARLYRLAGREGEAEEHLARADKEAEQEAEYGHACVASVSGDVERALALLQVALEAGQLQPGWARIDPEFVYIKDDLRFKALVAG